MILSGRVSRSEAAWAERVSLAEALGARVATDTRVGAGFPTDHELHIGAPSGFPSDAVCAALREADVILSLDWVDLGGALKTACNGAPEGRVIQVSRDHQLHNGWSMDHQGLPAVDLLLAADTDATVTELLKLIPHAPPRAPAPRMRPVFTPGEGMIHIDQVSAALQEVTQGSEVSLLHISLSWNGATWAFRHPLDYIGSDGGGGVGGGPGISVGAALALRDSGRLPIAVCGDGDFMMGSTSIWTAVHYRIPLLIVVANNQSFYNDEVHQERMAKLRNRPVENKWIGQRMIDPGIDVAGIARAQGAVGIGPVESQHDLLPALQQAVAALREGKVVVVDVRIMTGYSPAMAAALTRAE